MRRLAIPLAAVAGLALALAAYVWTAGRPQPSPDVARPASETEAVPAAASERAAARIAAADLACGDCNLLLISIDTLRADRMQVYGSARDNTPHLSTLAAGGVLFERFYHSGGGTLPSHLTMLTALAPFTHGVDTDTGTALDPRWVTLAEHLSDAGFTTAAFVDGGWLISKFGFARGFDYWDQSGGQFLTILPKAHRWLDAHREERFFLFLHTYDVHSGSEGFPYDCPGDWSSRYGDRPTGFDGCRDGLCASDLLASVNTGIREGRHSLSDVFSSEEVAAMSASYDGCIGYVDARIADFLGALRVLGLYDETLVVVTSDHGEEFGEHGMLIHDQGGYEEIAHIPLIVKLPNGRLAGRRVTGLTAMIDLAPTLLELLEAPPLAQAQGRSLVPVMAADRRARDAVHMYRALVTDDWKYIPTKNELYRYREDPAETVNLYGTQPAVQRGLARRLAGLIAADERARRSILSNGESAVELSVEERERLRALGYLR